MRIFINSLVQNKNTLMLITSLAFMCGILSYFNNIEIFSAVLISVISIALIVFDLVSPRLVLIWITVFYLGFFNAYFRVAPSDALLPAAPADTVLTGQIVSIPTDTATGGKKFFFKVNEAGGEKLNAKTFVTINPDNSDFPDLQPGDVLTIKGKLRVPFDATNPSQFAYKNYLRNFKAYTTFYAKAADCEEIPVKLSLKWKFLQGLNHVRE